MITKTGGGAFDPGAPNLYFIASGVARMVPAAPTHDNLLVAINEIGGTDHIEIERWLDQGKRLFIDSGIFNLTMKHSRAHNVPMDVALSLAPDEIDGFGELWDKYLDIIGRYGDRVWGYIELDQGGRENKIKTRAKLETLGLRPIPVYHPLNDGWDYFDYLAERYDRICFGNIVRAYPPVRMPLIATAWERHRKYPNLWIHLLGHTPNQYLYNFPSNSCDSSAWLGGLRYTKGQAERANGATASYLQRDFRYTLGSESANQEKACALSGYIAHFVQTNWQSYWSELEALGCTQYPSLDAEPSPASSPPSPPRSM